jgi:N-acetylglucosaminyl-diphospho-decaprenol L-rhamnosyltransferase
MAGESNAPSRHESGPTVDIVIVNWNSQTLLRECVAALEGSTIAEQLKVVVVDNASTDGSSNGLKAGRASLEVAHNATNRGFAAACNQGAERGRSRFVLFLNPDVRVRSDTIANAVRYMDDPTNSGVGILGAQLLDADGDVQRSCARAPTATTLLLHALFLDRLFPAFVPPHFLTEWDHGDTRAVDQVMGAFLLIRRSLFERLGGFDERFFLYFEDVDLCLRARQAGWSVVHLASARAEHTGGGTTAAIKDRRLCYLANSKVAYTAKHHGPTAAVVLIALTLCFDMPIRLLHAIVARSPEEGLTVARGTALFWRSLPELWGRVRGE